LYRVHNKPGWPLLNYCGFKIASLSLCYLKQ
jgi:hypothetical protein